MPDLSKKDGPDPTPIFVPYATVSGGLTGDEVRDVVEAHERDVKACRYAAGERDAFLVGSITLDLSIGPDGSVTSAQTKESTLGNRPAAGCLEEVARQWKFPAPRAGSAEVQQPFHFGQLFVPERATVDAGLTPEQIRQVVSAHWAPFWGCVKDQIDSDRTLSGKVTLAWTVGADGKVAGAGVKSADLGSTKIAVPSIRAGLAEAHVKDSELGNAKIEQCLLNAVSSLTFPAPTTGAAVAVSMPVEVRPMTVRNFATANVGGLSADDIETVQDAHIDDIGDCRDAEVDGAHELIDLSGEVRFRYQIGPDGHVTDASVKSSDLHNENIEQCVVREIKSWKFPAPKDGQPVNVEFTRIFQPSIAPPLFKGFAAGLSISDGTGLNRFNYSNELYMLFEGSWAFGKLLFERESPFYRMTTSIRFPLSYALAGYDPESIVAYNNHGLPSSCSDVGISQNGTVNPATVARCGYPNNYQAVPGDIWLGLSVPEIYDIPKARIKITPAVRVVIPVSPAERFHTAIMGVRFGVGFKRSFFARKLEIEYSIGASRTFFRNTAPQIQTGSAPLPDDPISNSYSVSDINSSNTDFYASPGNASGMTYMNMPWSLNNALFVDYNPTDRLHFEVGYQITDAFSYSIQCGSASYGGVSTNPCTNANMVAQAGHSNGTGGTTTGASTTFTQDRVDIQRFVASISYDVRDWMDVEATLLTDAPLRFPDNSLRQPFLWTNYDAFSTVYIGAKFAIGNTK